MRWVLVVLLAVVMVAAGCSDDDDTAEGAFTFADDDLCVWVSEDEVAEFVAAEIDDPHVTAVLAESSGEPEDPASCHWHLQASTAPDGFGSVSAGNAEFLWTDVNGVNHEYAEVEVVDFDAEVGYVEIDSAVSGHPSLSEGVAVYNGAWGQFAFWVPPGDEYLSVSVSFPREESGDGDPLEYEDPVFGVADRIVQELGWLS